MKQANFSIGLFIIAIALLIFVTNVDITPSKELPDPSSPTTPLDKNVLFQISDQYIGRDYSSTTSFPTIHVGSTIQFTEIFSISSLPLEEDPLSRVNFTKTIPLPREQQLEYLLIDANLERSSGSAPLELLLNNETIYYGNAPADHFPLKIIVPQQDTHVTFSARFPETSWYEFWKWNSGLLNDINIIQAHRDTNLLNTTHLFTINNKQALHTLHVRLQMVCQQTSTDTLDVYVNNFLVGQLSSLCTPSHRASLRIPHDILQAQNTLSFSSQEKAVFSFDLRSTYTNEQKTFYFTFDDFSAQLDVTAELFADKSSVEVEINGESVTLKSEKQTSLLPYLVIGNNELHFTEKNLYIDSLRIKRVDFD